MFSHITLGTNDLEVALQFYDAILEPLGIVRLLSSPEHGFAAYGHPGERPGLFVCLPFNEKEATAGNGTHVALLASSREAVDAFHACGLALGATDEGAPGPRPHYHEHYYGAYLRDLDGNKLQACCHAPA